MMKGRITFPFAAIVATTTACYLVLLDSSAFCGTLKDGTKIAFAGRIKYDDPFVVGTLTWPVLYKHEDQDVIRGQIKALRSRGLRAAYEVVIEPSIAYSIEVTNDSSEPGAYAISGDFLIAPYGANTTTRELNVELIDANNDGTAYFNGNFGDEGAIEAARLRNTENGTFDSLGAPLGSNISSPGNYSFAHGPFTAPTLDGGDEVSLSTFFVLSPGDTARITSRLIIDEGSGIPFAEIPDLPDPDDGPYLNIVDLDAPDAFLGDNQFIASQTQLNLSDGGSIGQRFNFDAFMNNQLNDNNFDVEVNITGGTVGHQFMALGGTTVNMSGGVVGHDGAVFLAGSYSGLSEDVVVNISGGTMEAGILANGGSITNISGGTVNSVSATSDAVVNISGGTIGLGGFSNPGFLQTTLDGVFNISGGTFAGNGRISLLDRGVANISGGSLIAENHVLEARADSEVHLLGTEFLIDGAPIEGLVPGEAFEITDRGDVTLSGLLTDGSPFSIGLFPTHWTVRFDQFEDNPTPHERNWIHPEALLTVTLILPGDFNDDGVVNAADYVVWRNNNGQEVSLPNDTTPGSVSQADYVVWVENFGNLPNGSGAVEGNAVPEPAAAIMLVIAFLAIAATSRQ